MAAPVLIDTDPGIDDALALLFGWNSPEISVEAITTVAGNVPVEQGTVNVFRLLGLREPSPRPVIGVGAAEPLARRSEEHTSELQSHSDLVCRLLLEKKKKKKSA